MAVPGANAVIDISHFQTVSSFEAVRRSGIVAVIHKATEGTGFRDPTYRARKTEALAAGFLWGSYHFADGGDPTGQVESYLAYAEPTASELVCLDFEAPPGGPAISLAGAEAFVLGVERATGRLPVVYGGSYLRQVTAGRRDTILSRCPLWLAHYDDVPVGIPDPWTTWTLWQYTDGSAGPAPHAVDGIGRCDRDTFNGSLEELRRAWPLTRAAEPPAA